jgi:hypothetical protein
MQIAAVEVVIVLALFLGDSVAQAAQRAELWARWQKQDAASVQKIDHGVWDRFLKQYVVGNHPSGIHRVRYQEVGPEDFKNLQGYVKSLQAVAISNYNRKEQRLLDQSLQRAHG